MTDKRSVSDEQLGQLARKQHDLFRRVREGSLEQGLVEYALQRIIEPIPSGIQRISSSWVRMTVGSAFREFCSGRDFSRSDLEQIAHRIRAVAEAHRFDFRAFRIEYDAPYGDPVDLRRGIHLLGWRPASVPEALAYCLNDPEGLPYRDGRDVILLLSEEIHPSGWYAGFQRLGGPAWWSLLPVHLGIQRWVDVTGSTVHPMILAVPR
jgi:hypothetical protein